MELIEAPYGLLIWQVFLILLIGLWVYSLIDLLRSSFKRNDKLIWLLALLFIPILGAVLYLIIGKKQKIDKASTFQ